MLLAVSSLANKSRSPSDISSPAISTLGVTFSASGISDEGTPTSVERSMLFAVSSSEDCGATPPAATSPSGGRNSWSQKLHNRTVSGFSRPQFGQLIMLLNCYSILVRSFGACQHSQTYHDSSQRNSQQNATRSGSDGHLQQPVTQSRQQAALNGGDWYPA